MLLADITHKLGERRMVFVYIALAMAMQLLFWFVPNIIVNAVAVCVLGMYALSQLAPPWYTRKQIRFE